MSAIIYPCGCVERSGDTKPFGDPNKNPRVLFAPEGQKLPERKDSYCKNGNKTVDIEIVTEVRDGEPVKKTVKRWACERRNQREDLPEQRGAPVNPVRGG